jgi:hypothetical protein
MKTQLKMRLFSVFFMIATSTAFCADFEEIKKADSLFLNEKYTEAYYLYEDIFKQGVASPSMLLKMAFIQDGSENYPEALNFLDLYYKQTADKSVVSKIEEIAEDNDLKGYNYDDLSFFSILLKKYRSQGQLILVALAVMLLAYAYRKRKDGYTPSTAFALQIVVLGCLLFVSNYQDPAKGIIQMDQTLLRSAPSAGGEPVVFISKGHRVKILKQADVWTKIDWEGEEVYVRNSRLQII